MKKTLVKSALLAIMGVSLVAGTALATPVTFSGGSGDVDINILWELLGSSLSLDSELQVGPSFSEFTLNGHGIGSDFTLADGQRQTIDFFELSFDGRGVGDYEIEASLDFVSPIMDPVIGEGWGGLGEGDHPTLGYISGGTLTWAIQPGLVTLADGNILSITFEDVVTFGMGDSRMVHATIENQGGGSDMNPVPEPATMLLFGTGLAGLAGLQRRKQNK